MKALIFAAGLGTRLKPLTDDKPKALVKIEGVTLLEHVIQRLKSQGWDDIVINVHHFADLIIDFLRQKHDFGIKIAISDERGCLLETGGGIKKAIPLLRDADNQPFLVHNVDILSNANLKSLYLQHVDSHADATLLVSQRKSSRNLMFDDEGQLTGWINRQTGQTKPKEFTEDQLSRLRSYAFSGIHVLSPTLFDDFNLWEGKFSVIDFYLSLTQKRRMLAYTQEGLRLIDVGKKENLQEAALFTKSL